MCDNVINFSNVSYGILSEMGRNVIINNLYIDQEINIFNKLSLKTVLINTIQSKKMLIVLLSLIYFFIHFN